MFGANQSLGRELYEHESDGRAAGPQILGKVPFGWQAITRDKRRIRERPDGRLDPLRRLAHRWQYLLSPGAYQGTPRPGTVSAVWQVE